MTTIAYRDGSLCSDSCASINGARVGTVRKIFKTKKGILVGSAGLSGDCHKLLDWAEHDFKHSTEFDDCFSAIVIFPNGCVRKVDSHGILLDVKQSFHALGSGMELALGAMEMGATAREAVKVGIKYDCYSSGRIQELNI